MADRNARGARFSPDQEAGESEFSWGRGLAPPEARGYTPTNFDEMKNIMATDPADPEAVADHDNPGNEGNPATGGRRSGTTRRVRERGRP